MAETPHAGPEEKLSAKPDGADKELAKGLTEAFLPGAIPLIKWFLRKEGKGMRDGFWGILLLLIAVSIVSYKFGTPDPEEKRELVSKVKELERDKQHLQVTVAPLIERAAKEFPGEEINQSLKKIIDKLSKDPLQEPIATIRVSVQFSLGNNAPKPSQSGANFANYWGAVAFSRGDDVLWGKTPDYRSDELSRLIFALDCEPDSKVLSKPLRSFRDVDTILFMLPLETVPIGTRISGGVATVVLNGYLRLEFDVQAQPVGKYRGKGKSEDTHSVFAIRDLARGMQPLMDTR